MDTKDDTFYYLKLVIRKKMDKSSETVSDRAAKNYLDTSDMTVAISPHIDHPHGTRSKTKRKQQPLFNRYPPSEDAGRNTGKQVHDDGDFLSVYSSDENSDGSDFENPDGCVNETSNLHRNVAVKSNLRMKIVSVKSLKFENDSDEAKTSGSKKLKHPCNICSRRFSALVALNLHRYKAHGIEIDGLMCKKCGQQCQYEYELEIHKTFVCRKSQRTHKCAECTLTFISKHQKEQHVCTKDPSKPIYCLYENCKFKTKTTSKLGEHLPRHFGIKQFLCSTCGASYTTKQDMLRHADSHKPRADCTCQVCGKSYKSMHSLQQHMWKHKHRDRYKCDHCPYTTPSLDSFKKHTLKHDPDPKYKCDTCGKNVRSKSSLRRHIIDKHTREKIFTCKYCDFTSTKGASYSGHMRIHRNIRETSPIDEDQTDANQSVNDAISVLSQGFASPTTYFSISKKQCASTPVQTNKDEGHLVLLSTDSPAQPLLVADPSLHFEGEVNISGQNADTLFSNMVSSAESQDISVIAADAPGTSLNLYSTESVSHGTTVIPLPNLILSESFTEEEN